MSRVTMSYTVDLEDVPREISVRLQKAQSSAGSHLLEKIGRVCRVLEDDDAQALEFAVHELSQVAAEADKIRDIVNEAGQLLVGYRNAVSLEKEVAQADAVADAAELEESNDEV